MKRHPTAVLPAQQSAEPRTKALQCVLAPAVSRPCVPTVGALRGLQTYHPHPPPPPRSTSGAHQKDSVLFAQLRKRLSSWELRKGEEEKKAESSFPSMLQTFRGGSRGRGQRLGVEERIFEGPLHLVMKVRSRFPHPPCPSHSTFPSCPSSQIVLPPASERGYYCSLQQAIPVDTHPTPGSYPFWHLGILNSHH